MKVYKGNFGANGHSLINCIEDTNRNRLVKTLKGYVRMYGKGYVLVSDDEREYEYHFDGRRWWCEEREYSEEYKAAARMK